jgi:hypothetical protein
MSNIIAGQSRSGQNNNAGDDRALFEKKMQTDVLRFFQSTNVAKELVTTKTIQNGKSAAFPVVGNASASYHEVGTELGSKKIASTEREITIDKILEAHTYVPDIDDAMVHYDANSAYNEAIGRALGKKYDQDLFRMIVKAAKITDSTDAAAAGLLAFNDDIYSTPVTFAAAGDELKGDKVYAKIVEAVAQWVEKDIVGEPVIVLKPASYYALLNNPAQTGMTWANDDASQSGKVPMVLGKRVLTSPHVPQADDSANSAVLTKYRGDFRGTVGVMFSKEAVGALELMSLQLRSDYVPTRLSTLIVGKMLVGFGILNHSAAIVFNEFSE